MNILDQVLKEIRNEKKEKEEKSKCPLCGSKNIINNTFKHGSRIGGTIECKECNKLIRF